MTMLNRQTRTPVFQEVSLPNLIDELTKKYTRLWYATSTDLPDLGRVYTPKEQAHLEKEADRLLNGLVFQLKHMPKTPAERAEVKERIRAAGLAFARSSLGLEDRQIELVKSHHFLEIAREFAGKARAFDASISHEDIFQASRNVLTMNFLQLLLGLPVELTPSVFAYSMLYPYTDNYLDDPAISRSAKLDFNERFYRRLSGEGLKPSNHYEQALCDLVSLIEGQFDRSCFPQVYDSLLAIHQAQFDSLRLHQRGASPYEIDVPGLSFEKGGVAVVADGCLVAGSLLPAQADFMYGYGAFTQLMDDLEDLAQDRQDGILTIFTQTAQGWKLDSATNQLFNLGSQVMALMDSFASPASMEFKELMVKGIQPAIIDAAGQSSAYFSRSYLRALETHMPFRLASLAKQRKKLKCQNISNIRLIEALV